ncbi:DUF5719 family protein [Allostreptomyces psammosilenae]|uniref:Secreted protein n=1 Tax=Allostreptomyces psammosilenae TaxID=1892865 RepID=A0A852ZW25_9ACTN|nr:DUF5719 family protein [Allostreptomyces psammosilenae]NYI06155.1 hypothetical protein [Allostreptomyces psammosilenae]
MNRTSIVLGAVAVALALIGGLAFATTPETGPTGEGGQQVPVRRTTALCPQVFHQEDATTTYTAFAPPSEGTGDEGTGTLSDMGVTEPRAELAEPGTPASTSSDKGDAAPVLGQGEGRFAPGFALQETTSVSGDDGHLAGSGCAAPGSSFWFVGAATVDGRSDYLHLANAETETPAVVDVELYGPDGPVEATGARNITVTPGASVPLLLSSFTEQKIEGLAVHVQVRSGRVSAQLHDDGGADGADWLPPAGDPAGTVLVPGLPGDATKIQLTVATTGEQEAELAVQISGKGGLFTPAGTERISVPANGSTTVDLGDITAGDASAILLTPAEGAEAVPVVAGLRVLRGGDDGRDSAYSASSPALGETASVSGNIPGASTVYLTAPGEAATVRLTAYPDGAEPATAEVEVPAGATVAVAPPEVPGDATFGLTVEPLSGGPVHAARQLTGGGDEAWKTTVQTVATQPTTVLMPQTRPDWTVVQAG